MFLSYGQPGNGVPIMEPHVRHIAAKDSPARRGSRAGRGIGRRLGRVESLPVPPLPLVVEREAAFERIKAAYADEVISYDGMEQRLDGVLSAATDDEVLAVIADLPAVVEDAALEIEAINGRITRRGAWRVPRRIRISSEYGKVELDLSQATFGSDKVEIVLELRYGWARIVVPTSAVVDLDGLVTDWKQPSYRRPGHGPGSRPLIRIIGHMEYGRLKVRHR